MELAYRWALSVSSSKDHALLGGLEQSRLLWGDLCDDWSNDHRGGVGFWSAVGGQSTELTKRTQQRYRRLFWWSERAKINASDNEDDMHGGGWDWEHHVDEWR